MTIRIIFHHFSIKSMDTSFFHHQFTPSINISRLSTGWQFRQTYLIRWANHGQSWHFLSPFETTYIYVYIYVEYIPIYIIIVDQSSGTVSHFLLFWTHQQLSILTTYRGSKWVKPMPRGQRAGRDASCDVCAKRSQGVPWKLRGRCDFSWICWWFFYGHFLAILYMIYCDSISLYKCN